MRKLTQNSVSFSYALRHWSHALLLASLVSASPEEVADLALHRPCEPIPECRRLVDGNSSTAVGGWDSQKAAKPPGLRGMFISNFPSFSETPAAHRMTVGSSSTTAGSQTYAAREIRVATMSKFKVDLGGTKQVTSIIIICGSKDSRIGDADSDVLAHLDFSLQLWSPGGASLRSPEFFVQPSRIDSGQNDGFLQIEFHLGKRPADTVMLKTRLPSTAGSEARGLCGHLPIADVSVYCTSSSPPRSSAAARRQSQVWMAMPQQQAPISLARDSPKDESSNLQNDEFLDVQNNPARDSFFSDSFLPPSSESRSAGQTSGGFGTVVIAAAAVFLALLSLIARTCCALLPSMQKDANCSLACSYTVAEPIGSASILTSSGGAGGVRANPADDSRVTTSYYWIGDEDESAENAQDEHVDGTQAEGHQPEPDQLAQASSTLTESEPEAELHPESRCSTPREPSGASVHLRGVEFQRAPELSLPPAWQVEPSFPRPSVQVDDSSGELAVVTPIGKVLMLYASPLCRLDPMRGPLTMPSINFEREWEEVLCEPYQEAVQVSTSRQRKHLPTLSAQSLTSSSLQKALTMKSGRNSSMILHISAHGVGGGLVLEDGRGTAHILSCDLLRELLDLRAGFTTERLESSPRLVILNTCSSLVAGQLFADCGIPHVICTSEDIKDSWSRLFLRTLYASVFSGCSVREAFAAAKMALRCDQSSFEAAAAFQLLPEEQDHSDVLFPRATQRRRMPKPNTGFTDGGREGMLDVRRHKPSRLLECTPFHQLPELPEDFIGRHVDTWSILQHLAHRRVIVICNLHGEANLPGVGKSALMDAVRRSAVLRTGSHCVAVKFEMPPPPGASLRVYWIRQVQQAVLEVLHNEIKRSRLMTAVGANADSNLARNCLRRVKSRSKCASLEEAPQQQIQEAESFRELFEAVIRNLRILTEMRRTHGNMGLSYGSGGSGGILLLLRSCDHLVQQQHVQETLAELLRRCPACRIILSSRQRMVGHGVGQFKAVHHELKGLAPRDAARLFLSRAQRPLTWGELSPVSETLAPALLAMDPKALVTLQGEHREDLLDAVANQPAVVKLRGRPGAIIELSSKLGPGPPSMKELNQSARAPKEVMQAS
eukprot:TRINITY_DN5236_c0_g1_i2.p1 TRINITY_DN5236_c0_g1~~TRINITY_DN5236_c0_g1_i2.p1  ORF type:complete len:1116 (-),score=168.42 TRINITY_DN5236_c0_g1_i2:70-3417(-)